MKTILSTIFLIVLSNYCFAQYLRINDPQTWRGGQGTIKESKITFEPQGLFMKVDWELTFTAEGLTDFSEKDTVEVVYNFTLPEGAVVNDSWLWFGDSILEGMIIDRWSASQVYENIVNRRRDPSILYKNGKVNYELRIFPMAAKENRKVKISALLPTNWTQNKINTKFLSNNLMATKYPVKVLEVNAKLTDEYKNPVLAGEQEIVLEPLENPENGITHQKFIEFEELSQNQVFEVSSPMKDGYYMNIFEAGDEKFYQLALHPAQGIDNRKPQKVLFLIDYQKENGNISQTDMLSQISINLRELMNEKDSFNIFFYDFQMRKAGENWIPGDSASITEAIIGMGKEPFVSYGNLPSLLAGGIESVKGNEDTKIILLANSDKLNDTELANQLIEDLMELMDPVIPIYIGDFQTNSFYSRWINNVYYRGNEYFYRNLAKLTGGDYTHSFEGSSFPVCLRNIYLLATSESGLIDIHTTMAQGFCYGRYKLSDQPQNILNSMYLETGKFSGEFPFEIEISGLYNEELFSKKISLQREDIFDADSTVGTFWYGNEIQEMENSNYSYSRINDIIDISIDNRILSTYTAFLCLEPGMMGELDNIANNDANRGWEDGGGIIISAQEVEEMENEVQVYPNPFTDRVTIEISLSQEIDETNTKLEIYDLFGKQIKSFTVDQFVGESDILIKWDASDFAGNPVPKGTYIFICITPDGRISKKLILM